MTIEAQLNSAQECVAMDQGLAVQGEVALGSEALGSNLAALLDRFTSSVTDPAAHTVGEFAATVGALHGELNMLAHHFGGDMYASDDVDFDEIFPAESTGLAAEEELQHLCWQISA